MSGIEGPGVEGGSGGGGGTPGGTTGQIQYNNAGAFGGIAEGTAAQVLISAGAGLPPAFGAVVLPTVVTGAHQFSGAVTFNSTMETDDDFTVGATLFLSNPVTPAALAAGNTDDYNPTSLGARSIFRLTPNATGSVLTGLQAQAANMSLSMFNIQTGALGTLTLAHQNVGSVATNRFICPGEVDFVVPAGGSVRVWRDGATGRWRVMQ